MRKALAAGLVVLLALSVAAGAYAEPVKLEYKYKKDDVSKFNLAVEVKAQLPDTPEIAAQMPLEFAASMVQSQRVMAVNRDGSARVKVWTGDIKLSSPAMPEMANQKPPASTTYMTVASTGKVLGVELPKEITSASGAVPPIPPAMMSSLQKWLSDLSDYGALPANPVEVGESWNKELTLPANLGKANIDSKLVSVSEQYAGSRAARITQTMSGQVDVAQVVKAVLGSFASMMGPDAKVTELPEITGTLSVNGIFDTYFSVEKGKPLGQLGTGSLTLKMNMPEEVVKQGAPSVMRVIVDFKVSAKAIK